MEAHADHVKKNMHTFLQANYEEFIKLSDSVWDFAEVRFEEKRSAALQMEFLHRKGFVVHHPIAQLDTAFYAEYGCGKPVVAILGEFDALPGLSQDAGVTEQRSSTAGKAGHGCGHNLLGTAGVAAVCALKIAMEAAGIRGTIRYYGCPAEEGGGGKCKMLLAGAFQDVDIALSWHPSTENGLYVAGTACASYIFSFKGLSSHANVAPHAGRSALDAAELMNVGANFLREHLKRTISIQYAFIDAGGPSSNIIPDHAKVSYTIRATSAQDVRETFSRLEKVAQGAALMTETTLLPVEKKFQYANILPNDTLEDVVLANVDRVFPMKPTEEELEQAKQFQNVGIKPDAGTPICVNFDKDKQRPSVITTDFGDVSWVVPAISFSVATAAVGTRVHHWSMTAQGKTNYAYRGMFSAALLMAYSACDIFEQPSLVNQAKIDLENILNGNNYFKMHD